MTNKGFEGVVGLTPEQNILNQDSIGDNGKPRKEEAKGKSKNKKMDHKATNTATSSNLDQTPLSFESKGPTKRDVGDILTMIENITDPDSDVELVRSIISDAEEKGFHYVEHLGESSERVIGAEELFDLLETKKQELEGREKVHHEAEGEETDLGTISNHEPKEKMEKGLIPTRSEATEIPSDHSQRYLYENLQAVIDKAGKDTDWLVEMKEFGEKIKNGEYTFYKLAEATKSDAKEVENDNAKQQRLKKKSEPRSLSEKINFDELEQVDPQECMRYIHRSIAKTLSEKLKSELDGIENLTLQQIDRAQDEFIGYLNTLIDDTPDNEILRDSTDRRLRTICAKKRAELSEGRGKKTIVETQKENVMIEKPVKEKTEVQKRKVNPEVAEIAQLNREEFSTRVSKIKSLPKLIDIRNQIGKLYNEGKVTTEETDSKYDLVTLLARQAFIERIEGDLKKVHDLDALSVLSSNIEVEYGNYFDQEIGGPLEDFIMEDKEKLNALIGARVVEIKKEAEEQEAANAPSQTDNEQKTDPEPSGKRVKLRGPFIDASNPNLTLPAESNKFQINSSTTTNSSADLTQIFHRGAPKPTTEEIPANKINAVQTPKAENQDSEKPQARDKTEQPVSESPKPAFEGLPIPPPPSQRAKAPTATIEAKTPASAPEKKTPPPLPKQKTPIEVPAQESAATTPEAIITQQTLKAEKLADAKKKLEEASAEVNETKTETSASPSSDGVEITKRSGPMKKTIRNISLKENMPKQSEIVDEGANNSTPAPASIPVPEPRRPKIVPLPSSSSPYENKSPVASLVKKAKGGWGSFFSRFSRFFKSKSKNK